MFNIMLLLSERLNLCNHTHAHTRMCVCLWFSLCLAFECNTLLFGQLCAHNWRVICLNSFHSFATIKRKICFKWSSGKRPAATATEKHWSNESEKWFLKGHFVKRTKKKRYNFFVDSLFVKPVWGKRLCIASHNACYTSWQICCCCGRRFISLDYAFM